MCIRDSSIPLIDGVDLGNLQARSEPQTDHFIAPVAHNGLIQVSGESCLQDEYRVIHETARTPSDDQLGGQC